MCHVRRMEETKAQRDMNTYSIFNEERTLKQTYKTTNERDAIYKQCRHRQLDIDNNPRNTPKRWLPKYGSQSETPMNSCL